MEVNELYDLLQSIGIDRLRIRHGNISACCPFHSESNASWGISTTEPHFHGCFSCHARGTLLDLLIRVGQLSKTEARRYCSLSDEEMAMPVLDFRMQARTSIVAKENLYPFDWTFQLACYFGVVRGVNPAIAQAVGIVHNKKDCRAMFPWFLRERLVGITGRALDDNPAKTLPYYGTKKGHYLYLPSGYIRKGRFVLLEGEIDALKVFCAGESNVGAVGFGNFTDRQKSLMLNCGVDSVVTFFDDDPTGELMHAQVSKKFDGIIPVTKVDYQPFRERYTVKLDPGAMSREHIRMALKPATKYSGWSSF